MERSPPTPGGQEGSRIEKPRRGDRRRCGGGGAVSPRWRGKRLAVGRVGPFFEGVDGGDGGADGAEWGLS